MKRATLEAVLSFATTRRLGGGERRDILDSDARQRAKLKKQAAEIRDLKARLAVCRGVCRVLMLQMGEQGLAADDVDWLCIRATDLKNKEWNKS